MRTILRLDRLFLKNGNMQRLSSILLWPRHTLLGLLRISEGAAVFRSLG